MEDCEKETASDRRMGFKFPGNVDFVGRETRIFGSSQKFNITLACFNFTCNFFLVIKLFLKNIVWLEYLVDSLCLDIWSELRACVS